MELKLHYKQHLSEELRFNEPYVCDRMELDSVLDCYSAQPRGNWSVQPVLAAPLSAYESSRNILETLSRAGQHYETVGEYLLSKADEFVRPNLEVLLGLRRSD